MSKGWTIYAALVLAGSLAVAATAQEQSVSGNWSGTATSRAGGNTEAKSGVTMTLTQSGQDVTGTYSVKVEGAGRTQSGRELTDIPVKGSLTGNKLSLTIGRQGRLEATVDGDSMTGSVARANFPPSSLSATRTK